MTTRRYNPRGIRTDRPLSYARVEKIALAVRELAGLANDPLEPFPCAEMFERLDDLKVDDIAVTYAVERLEYGIEGKTRYCKRLNRIEVVLAERTYEALQHEDPRARFSMLHEVSHAVLHPREVIRLADALHPAAGLNRGCRHRAFEDTEWQADALAAASLIPALGLKRLEDRGELSVAEIASRFRTSYEAAKIRLACFDSRGDELLAAVQQRR